MGNTVFKAYNRQLCIFEMVIFIVSLILAMLVIVDTTEEIFRVAPKTNIVEQKEGAASTLDRKLGAPFMTAAHALAPDQGKSRRSEAVGMRSVSKSEAGRRLKKGAKTEQRRRWETSLDLYLTSEQRGASGGSNKRGIP